jgi:hypothetical protein
VELLHRFRNVLYQQHGFEHCHLHGFPYCSFLFPVAAASSPFSLSAFACLIHHYLVAEERLSRRRPASEKCTKSFGRVKLESTSEQ